MPLEKALTQMITSPFGKGGLREINQTESPLAPHFQREGLNKHFYSVAKTLPPSRKSAIVSIGQQSLDGKSYILIADQFTRYALSKAGNG